MTGLARRTGLVLPPGLKVGLYGGSFNPPHAGHRHVAETALRRLGLHRVVWLVAPQNPLKPRVGAGLAERTAAARRLARGPRMAVSDLEARIGSPYTIDVARALKARHPAVRFVWIMGADAFQGLHAWRRWPELMRSLPIAVVARPGARFPGLSPAARRFARARLPERAARRLPFASPPAFAILTGPLHPASSTALRGDSPR